MLNPPGPAKNNLRELEATSSASATTIAPCHLAAVGTTDFLSLVVLEYGDWIRMQIQPCMVGKSLKVDYCNS